MRNSRELQNFAITLSWTSSSPLNYKFLLVANPTFSSAGLSNVNPEQVIVIIFDIPTFNEVLSYTILGSMSYQHGNNKMVLKLPCPIQLVPQDVTDNSVIVHLYEVIDGSTDDILALTYSSQKYDFIMNTCHKSVENLFEEDCSLSRIKLKSDGKLFLVHKISPCLDGALLLVQDYTKNGTIHLSVYCRSLQVLSALLHYLHRQILNVFIIPKSLYREDLSVDEVTELVKNSLCKELDYLEQNWTGDVGAVRKNMTEKEHTTDCLMGRISEKRCS